MSIVLTDKSGRPVARPSRQATGTGIGMAQQSTVRVSVQPLNRVENRQLTGTAWRDVVSKIIATESNVPYVDGALTSVADYIGAITPDPATADTDWNAFIRPWLQLTLFESYDFDASGKFLFTDFQKQMWRYHDRDGDCLTVDTYEEPGNPLSRPYVRLVPCLGVDSPSGLGTDSPWIDGVRIGMHHRANAYHVLNEESAVNLRYVANRSGYVVPTGPGFLFANRRNIGASRGRSRFIASGNTVIDLATMDSATHRLFDLAAMFGIAFKSPLNGGQTPFKPLADAFEQDNIPSPSAVDSDGAAIDVEAVKEKLTREGSVILDLTENPGAEMQIQNVSQALPDVSAVRSSDLERIAMSYGLPVQILFCIFSGAFNLTGPGFRMTLTRAKRWREAHLRKLEPWVKKQYARHIAWGIATRQIPAPKKDILNQHLCRTTWERDIGIDEARDVKSDQIRLMIGATTEQEIAAEYGHQLADVIKQRAEFIQKVHNALGDKAAYWGENFQPNRPQQPADTSPRP